MEILKYIASILSGLAVTIPLVIKFYNVVKELVKNKNWNLLISLILKEMTVLETKFSTGVERKEFLLAELNELAVEANYPLSEEDVEKISLMIDSLCDMANVIGANKK